MSLTTITQSTQDDALRERLRASIAKESWANPLYGNTPTGQQVQAAWPNMQIEQQFLWPCCIDWEADYAYAVDNGNPNPGGDPGVIGDDEIQAGVQAHWPDPVTP